MTFLTTQKCIKGRKYLTAFNQDLFTARLTCAYEFNYRNNRELRWFSLQFLYHNTKLFLCDIIYFFSSTCETWMHRGLYCTSVSIHAKIWPDSFIIVHYISIVLAVLKSTFYIWKYISNIVNNNFNNIIWFFAM